MFKLNLFYLKQKLLQFRYNEQRDRALANETTYGEVLSVCGLQEVCHGLLDVCKVSFDGILVSGTGNTLTAPNREKTISEQALRIRF